MITTVELDIRDLRSDSTTGDDITDNELLIYFDIQRLLKARNYEDAIARIKQEIENSKSEDFRRSLLERLYSCYRRMYRMPEAIQTADRILKADPENLYTYIRKCDVVADADIRLAILEDAHRRAPFYPPILNRLAAEYEKRFEFPSSLGTKPKSEEIIDRYRKSTELSPEIENPAWAAMFQFIADHEHDAKKRDEQLTDILREHLKQNAYSHRTLRLLVRYCILKENRTFLEKDIFTYLEEGMTGHFPREEAEHFDVFSEACLEFEEHDRLRKLVQKYASNSALKGDPEYVQSRMGVQYNFYRDRDGAIALGEEFLKNSSSQTIDERLFELYVASGDLTKARAALERLKGLLTQDEYVTNTAELLEAEGKYQDSVDCIESIPSRDGFTEKSTNQISYLYLKMGEFEKARTVCKQLLEKHAFDISFQTEIINYEYAKLRVGKKPSHARLQSIINAPANKQTKGVALLLLGENDQGYEILEAEARRRFSRLHDFLKWPIVDEIRPRLLELRENLYNSRRSADWEPKIHGVIDI